MRKALFLAAVAITIGTAWAQQTPSDEFFERVHTACVTETSRRDTHTADQPTVAAYCRCTMGVARDEFTPTQFDIFGRYGIAQTSSEPLPSEAEMLSLETEDFSQRTGVLRTRIGAECNSIIWPQRPQ
jgi:CDP-diacylglycerol pyrophosphatase